MLHVFISYRRSDTSGYAGRLLDALEERFSGLQFFRDIEDLEPGVDFPTALDGKLSQCEAMLVVIGPTWASVAGATGPRIKEADDFVRIEVAAALARKEVKVIPVLVGGATLPKAQDLPPDLVGLLKRQQVELSDSRWDFDVDRLGKALDPSQRTAMLSGRAPMALAAAALVLVVALGGYWFMRSTGSASGDTQQATPDRRLADAERELRLAEIEAGKAKAAAEQAESEARKRRADAEARQADVKSSGPDASAVDRTRAAAEAAALAKASEEAQRTAAKAAETEATRRSAEAKLAEAKQAATAVGRAPSPATASSPTSLVLPTWVLNSGGCGAGPLTITGTATFSIAATPEGVVVTEDFRGTGGGFVVSVTGRATFEKPGTRYQIPTSGQWRGSKVFTSSGTDLVTSSDGKTPRTASVMAIRSNCG